LATFEVIQESLEGYARTTENCSSSKHVGVFHDYFVNAGHRIAPFSVGQSVFSLPHSGGAVWNFGAIWKVFVWQRISVERAADFAGIGHDRAVEID
jgi:hypothetical protein